MTSDSEFNTIRPYCDSEIEAAIERLCKSEEFLTLFTHLTKMDRATIQGALQGIRSRAEFQAKFFGPAIQSLINTTTDGITVSGMDKKKGAKAVGSIENFNIGKTYKNVGRTTSFYNDEPIHKITVNGCTFTTASNIGIVDTTYTLGITMEYWNLIFDNK